MGKLAMKKHLIISLLCLFAFGCGGIKPFVAPGFSGKDLGKGGLAVLPIFAGEAGKSIPGFESYCRSTGEKLAAELKKKQPLLKIVGPSEVSSVFGKEDLVSKYAKVMEDYNSVGLLDATTTKELSTPLGIKYLLITQIQSMYAEGNNPSVVLSARIWSVDKAEIVFETSVQHTESCFFSPKYLDALDHATQKLMNNFFVIYNLR